MGKYRPGMRISAAAVVLMLTLTACGGKLPDAENRSSADAAGEDTQSAEAEETASSLAGNDSDAAAKDDNSGQTSGTGTDKAADSAADGGDAADIRDGDEPDHDGEYLPGYASEEDFKERESGSASLITDRTVIVSLFINEKDDEWTEKEKEEIARICGIAYTYIADTMKTEYGTDTDLIYDWKENPDLAYDIRTDETIDAYVDTDTERHMDELELEWVEQVPYCDLMKKYDAGSIAFLYLIPHEGCSYSSMHFMADGSDIWNEGCLLYLQDMYSPTLDYETPTVYAHELLHLFGAEDYYGSAGVFSDETYETLKKECSEDIMYSTFDYIDGVYTTYPDYVRGKITPVTAYLLGVGDESAIKDMPELKKEQPGCFSGSTYDRVF